MSVQGKFKKKHVAKIMNKIVPKGEIFYGNKFTKSSYIFM
jgi:hypothetical protein